MDFYVVLFFAKFLIVPLVVFMVNADAPAWLKSGRLLCLIFAYFIYSLYKASFTDCFPLTDNGCLSTKTLILTTENAFFVMYVGWCEYLWRRIHGQIARPFKENMKYGLVSNAVLLVSAFVTAVFVVIMIAGHVMPLFFERH